MPTDSLKLPALILEFDVFVLHCTTCSKEQKVAEEERVGVRIHESRACVYYPTVLEKGEKQVSINAPLMAAAPVL